METKIALFQKKEIRKTLHADEWWFVITDVVAALTDSVDPSDYLKKLRKRDPSLGEAFKGGGQIAPPLVLSSTRRAGGSCSSASHEISRPIATTLHRHCRCQRSWKDHFRPRVSSDCGRHPFRQRRPHRRWHLSAPAGTGRARRRAALPCGVGPARTRACQFLFRDHLERTRPPRPAPALQGRRVAARVRQGGHDVPRADVLRRFTRGWQNFPAYRAVADEWAVYDNSGPAPVLLERNP
jgi:ribosomal protein L34